MNLINLNLDSIGQEEDNETRSYINNLRRQFQSSNLNIILGAGFSCDVVGLLANIEEELYDAEYININYEKVTRIKKKFFKNSILPLKDAINTSIGEINRILFLTHLSKIVNNRQSSILHKIVNLFTTNYDLLLETAFEKSHLEYVDGFSGKLRPMFSTANYGMIFSRQTSISSMTSEIVTFNLYKMHGSLNWEVENGNVVFCDFISKINQINATLKSNDEFNINYDELAIVNPTKAKLKQTVLDVNYYDQLRMFSNEMEKNNTILLSFGFSFNDEHIRQMTYRFLKGNPTLSLIILSFDAEATKSFKNYFETYSNVTILQLISESEDVHGSVRVNVEDFTLDHANKILEEIYDGTK